MEDIGNKGRERVEMGVDKKIRRRRRRRKKNPGPEKRVL
jgi:hypothetical protein